MKVYVFFKKMDYVVNKKRERETGSGKVSKLELNLRSPKLRSECCLQGSNVNRNLRRKKNIYILHMGRI